MLPRLEGIHRGVRASNGPTTRTPTDFTAVYRKAGTAAAVAGPPSTCASLVAEATITDGSEHMRQMSRSAARTRSMRYEASEGTGWLAVKAGVDLAAPQE